MGKEKPTQLLLPNPNNNPEIIIEEVRVKTAPPQKMLSPQIEQSPKINDNNDVPSTKNEIAKQQVYFSYLDAEQSQLIQIFNSSIKPCLQTRTKR
ncbi:hypothetical protein [Sporosarcina cyprini]|uniref:hypothetical protein n=1 Tax=Sporosarcina cyprini TaxID=2910523 RepID=UPI001EDEA995|nr:hypothetical protein [Sporosarcina cyprini]MCG3086380.1 hypothetical protein [Sporosarcina cyprini]